MFNSPLFHQWLSSSTPYVTHPTHNPSIRSDGGPMFETSTSLPVNGGNLTHLKLFDTKFGCFAFTIDSLESKL